MSAVFFVSFCPTGVAVKSIFVVVPLFGAVDVLDVEPELVLPVESLAVVVVDLSEPCVFVDGPCVLSEFPCVPDEEPGEVDAGPCDVVCPFGADGPWLPELPRCA